MVGWLKLVDYLLGLWMLYLIMFNSLLFIMVIMIFIGDKWFWFILGFCEFVIFFSCKLE